jgi:hypothetical protein
VVEGETVVGGSVVGDAVDEGEGEEGETVVGEAVGGDAVDEGEEGDVAETSLSNRSGGERKSVGDSVVKEGCYRKPCLRIIFSSRPSSRMARIASSKPLSRFSDLSRDRGNIR